MPAYLLARVQIHDPERYRAYVSATPDIVAQYGGKFIVRGGQTVTLEGEEEPRRVVIIEFPSKRHAEAFYYSPEYGKAKELRAGAATGQFVLLEGTH
jgi:uncharacterized protein (DUF1330 family)